MPLVFSGPEVLTFIVSLSLVVTHVPHVRTGEGPFAIAILTSGGMWVTAYVYRARFLRRAGLLALV